MEEFEVEEEREGGGSAFVLKAWCLDFGVRCWVRASRPVSSGLSGEIPRGIALVQDSHIVLIILTFV